MRRRTGRATTFPAKALAGLGALALAAGCGVVTGGGPHAVPKSQVPYHLLTKVSPSTTTTTAPVDDVPVTVFFIGPPGQDLVPARRAVPTTFSLRTVLAALLAGPTTTERTKGVRTALSGVQLLGVRPARPKATTAEITLDFNQAFGEISGTQQVQAVAQIVFTVTQDLGTAVGVQFEIDGVPTDVPTDTGAEVPGPVFRKDYASLAPSGTTPGPAA